MVSDTRGTVVTVDLPVPTPSVPAAETARGGETEPIGADHG